MSSIVKVDTIQENTSANGITVDGLNIKDSKLVTANSVIAANITADAIDATKIADNAISEEHLDVTSITGHTAETSIADGDTILIHDASASALRKMTKANFVSGIGGTNTPAFSAYASATQNGLTSGSYVKIVFGTELLDTDNTFATNRFTVPTGGAGTYHFSSNLVLQATNGVSELIQANGAFYKNGSIYAQTGRFDGRNAGYSRETALNGSLTVTLAEDDYIEVYGLVVTGSGTGEVNYGDKSARFSGYKILT